MQSLTKDELIKIHDQLVGISNEELDILSEYKLDRLTLKHKNAKTLIKKAAVLLHDIPHFQAFSEGNKRTAFSSLKIFLELNNKKLKATNKELEDIILRSVNSNITLNGAEKWLEERII